MPALLLFLLAFLALPRAAYSQATAVRVDVPVSFTSGDLASCYYGTWGSSLGTSSSTCNISYEVSGDQYNYYYLMPGSDQYSCSSGICCTGQTAKVYFHTGPKHVSWSISGARTTSYGGCQSWGSGGECTNWFRIHAHSCTMSLTFHYAAPSEGGSEPGGLPSCSVPKPVSEPRCIGGVGVSEMGGSESKLWREFAIASCIGPDFATTGVPLEENSYTNADGTVGGFIRAANVDDCNSYNMGSGVPIEHVCCQNGLVAAPPEPPPTDCSDPSNASKPECRPDPCELYPGSWFYGCDNGDPGSDPVDCSDPSNFGDPICGGAPDCSSSPGDPACNSVSPSSGSGGGDGEPCYGLCDPDGGGSGPSSGSVVGPSSGSSPPDPPGPSSNSNPGGGTGPGPGGSAGSGVTCEDVGTCGVAQESTQQGIWGTLKGLVDIVLDGLGGIRDAMQGVIGAIAGIGSGDGSGPGDGEGTGGDPYAPYPPYCYSPDGWWRLECGGNGSGPQSGGGSGGGEGEGVYPGVLASDYACEGVLGFFRRFMGYCEGEGEGDAEGIFGGFSYDTSGYSSKADALLATGGRGDRFSVYTDSELGALVPVPSGQCPVVQGGIRFAGRSVPYRWDFGSLVPGSPFNVAAFVKTVLLMLVYFANVFTMIRIFQTGGRS